MITSKSTGSYTSLCPSSLLIQAIISSDRPPRVRPWYVRSENGFLQKFATAKFCVCRTMVKSTFSSQRSSRSRGVALLPWGRGKIRNNLQRIVNHRLILYHVLIHIQSKFKLYPYIQMSKSKLGDFLNLAHFSLIATQCTQVANCK